MENADSPKWVGKSVRDIYGRRLGRVIGITFELGGKMVSIGVEHGGLLVEINPDRITSDREEIVIIPEWKLEARYVGLDRGGLTKRLSALTKMVNEKRISQELSKDILDRLSSVQKSQDVVIARTKARLDDLKRADSEIDGFVSLVTLQHLAGEMASEEYEFTISQCDGMKDMNEREVLDIRQALGMVATGDEIVAIHRDRIVHPSGNGQQSDVEAPSQMRGEPGTGVLATPYPDARPAGTRSQIPVSGTEVGEEAEPEVNPLFMSQRPGLRELEDLPVRQSPPVVGGSMSDESLEAPVRPEGPTLESGRIGSPRVEAPPPASFRDKAASSEASEEEPSDSGRAGPAEPILTGQVSEWVFAKIVDLEALDIKPGDYKPLRSLEK